MKGWRVSVLLALLACLPVLFSHASNPNLLQDSDTAFLVKTIRSRHAPMSWFAGDWPLGNHFYRPLPTLTFELDNRLYGNNPAGYSWTNDVLCVICVIALFWLLLEYSRAPLWAFAGASLFSLWQTGWAGVFVVPLFCASGLLVLVGMYRHSFNFARFVPASLVVFFIAGQVGAPQVTASRSLSSSMLDWLPGRTASVMTAFALAAMAAYVRYERGRDRGLPLLPPTALDMPRRRSLPPRHPRLWLGVCLVCVAGALASYEQAVMLPAALLGTGIMLAFQRLRPNWAVHVAFWLLLGGYLVLRHVVVPPGVSAYQAQQFRHGPAVWVDLAGYFLPNASNLMYVWQALTVGVLALLDMSCATSLVAFTSTVVTMLEVPRNWRIILGGWALSALAFLPMAWLKQFAHYHYWPLALRTIFILGIAKVAWQLVSIASSPPDLQAPRRLSPAPGSLPRQ